MKLIAALFTFVLIISSNAHAFGRDLDSGVRDQVENYYAASGEWSLLKIRTIEQVHTESREFILMSAKVHIQNIETGRGMKEICLVTFVADNGEFFSINCF